MYSYVNTEIKGYIGIVKNELTKVTPLKKYRIHVFRKIEKILIIWGSKHLNMYLCSKLFYHFCPDVHILVKCPCNQEIWLITFVM